MTSVYKVQVLNWDFLKPLYIYFAIFKNNIVFVHITFSMWYLNLKSNLNLYKCLYYGALTDHKILIYGSNLRIEISVDGILN